MAVELISSAQPAVTKATSAAQAQKKGQHNKGTKKWKSVHFRRPRTLKLPRDPKYTRKAVVSTPTLDKWRLICFSPQHFEASLDH
jgi:hypothetical protein